MKAIELRNRIDCLIRNWGDLEVELGVELYDATTERSSYTTDTQDVYVLEGKIYIEGEEA